MTATVPHRYKFRVDTAARWTSYNPVLLDKEAGFERDTGKIKIGDGSTAWNSLAYFTTGTSFDVTVPTGFTIADATITDGDTFDLDFDTGYSLPLTADTAKGVTAYGWGDHAAAGYYAAGGTDVAVADGGTGASNAATARTNLGLALGTDILDAYFIRLAANYTLTSTTSAQKLFDTTANGRLTLATGVYRIELQVLLTGMSATSGNATLDLLGAGSATLAGQSMQLWGRDNATGITGGNISGTSMSGTNTSAADAVLASTNQSMWFTLVGMFTVTGAGTIVPSIALTTAAAAVVNAGSYCVVSKIADIGTNSKGSWD